MTGYGPQEHWPIDEKMPFWIALEEQIVKAQLAGKSYILAFDANSKCSEKQR